MEYLLVVDGVQEDLVAAGTASGDWSCTPITDYWSYANRLWVVGSGNVTNVYGTCGTCVTTISGCTDSAATNYNASATVDDGSCSYAPVLSQIDLPVTWDDTTVDYTVTDFGGTVSSLSQDPLNSSNTVLMTEKTAGSQTWAGTTLSTSSGLLSAIPFVSGATTISAHVYSPASGVIVRLKAEDHTNGGISVETEATTTIANGWNTLVFDFANESNGTAAINKYSISAVGAGLNVNVQVPLPLSTATGPAVGSQFHHGPVIATVLAPLHTVVVIVSAEER